MVRHDVDRPERGVLRAERGLEAGPGDDDIEILIEEGGNVEVKFSGPDGVTVDLSEQGWMGTHEAEGD